MGISEDRKLAARGALYMIDHAKTNLENRDDQNAVMRRHLMRHAYPHQSKDGKRLLRDVSRFRDFIGDIAGELGVKSSHALSRADMLFTHGTCEYAMEAFRRFEYDCKAMTVSELPGPPTKADRALLAKDDKDGMRMCLKEGPVHYALDLVTKDIDAAMSVVNSLGLTSAVVEAVKLATAGSDYKYATEESQIAALELLCKRYRLQDRRKDGTLEDLSGVTLLAKLIEHWASHHSRAVSGVRRKRRSMHDFWTKGTESMKKSWMYRAQCNSESWMDEQRLSAFDRDTTVWRSSQVEAELQSFEETREKYSALDRPQNTGITSTSISKSQRKSENTAQRKLVAVLGKRKAPETSEATCGPSRRRHHPTTAESMHDYSIADTACGPKSVIVLDSTSEDGVHQTEDRKGNGIAESHNHGFSGSSRCGSIRKGQKQAATVAEPAVEVVSKDEPLSPYLPHLIPRPHLTYLHCGPYPDVSLEQDDSLTPAQIQRLISQLRQQQREAVSAYLQDIGMGQNIPFTLVDTQDLTLNLLYETCWGSNKMSIGTTLNNGRLSMLHGITALVSAFLFETVLSDAHVWLAELESWMSITQKFRRSVRQVVNQSRFSVSSLLNKSSNGRLSPLLIVIQDKAKEFARSLCDVLQSQFEGYATSQDFESDAQILIEEVLRLHVRMLGSDDEYTLFWVDRGAAMEDGSMSARYVDKKRSVPLHVLSSLHYGVEKTYTFGGGSNTVVLEKAEVLTSTQEPFPR